MLDTTEEWKMTSFICQEHAEQVSEQTKCINLSLILMVEADIMEKLRVDIMSAVT